MTDIAGFSTSTDRVAVHPAALAAAMLEHTAECHLLLEADGTVRWASDALEGVLGYGRVEIDGRALAALVHPDDTQRWSDALADIVADPGRRRRIQLRLRHADGQWRWARAVCTNAVERPGLGGIVVTITDVTARVMAKRRLAASERRLRSIVSSAGDVIAILDDRGGIDYITPTVTNLLDRSATTVRDDFVSYLHPDDIVVMSELFSAALDDPGTTQGPADLRLLRADGSWVTVEALITDFRQDPIVRGVVLNARDVSERRKAEREKEANRTILDTLIEMAPVGIFLADADGSWTYANARVGAELGTAPAALLGDAWTRHLAADDAARVRTELAGWDGSSSLVLEVKGADESEGRELRLTVSVPSHGDRSFGMVGTLEDVTQRRAADEMLVEGAALGSIAGVVGSAAHDLYNLLASIGMHVDLAGVEGDENLRLRAAEDALDRAFAITEDLMAMSRPGRGRVAPVDVGGLLADLTEMLRVLVDHQAELLFEDRSNGAVAAADQSGLERVITNLVVNSRDAVAPRGTIRVSVEVVEVADDEVVTPGRYVAIHVADDGAGIPDDVQSRMFEPYFTTKENGNGIGLAASRRNVRSWRGDIRFESLPGTGTTMTVLLPAA